MTFAALICWSIQDAARAAELAAQQPAQATLQDEESFLFLAMPAAWLIALVFVPLVIGFSWWTYSGLTRLEQRTKILLATLRGAAIVLCLLLLFQPAIERVRYTELQTQIHVLVDDSASMQRKDTYPDAEQRAALERVSGTTDLATASRSELVQRVLERPDGLLQRLRQDYDVRLFRFVRKPLPIADLGELTARGARTQIGDALELHLATAGAVNLSSLILVSDGRNNSGVSPVDVAQKYRLADIAIHTIGVGDPNPPRNVRLIGPPGPEDGLLGEELVFECTLDAEGLSGRSVNVTMQAAFEGGRYRQLAVERAVLGDDHVPVKVGIYHAFQEAGDYTLKFSVDTLPDETSHQDNDAVRFLRVEDEKIRVLYLEDLPRWDYRFVQNALRRVDDSIEMQAYLFDASKSFPQEHSESLPSLRDIPRTREELFRYHVLLIGDVPPEKLAATEDKISEWLDLLVEFVEFGGGVGFVFGPQAMPDRYRGTPLEDLLPVVLESPADLRTAWAPANETFRPMLENPEQPHDILTLLREPVNNRLLWERGFQPMGLYYPVQQAKAGATVLLRHPTRGNQYGRHVIAATSFYPRGRTFFLATDESWRWRNPYGEKHHDRFWRNVVRDLAAGRLQRRDDRLDLRVDRSSVETGGQVEVTLVARDDEFEPVLIEQYPVFLRRADGTPERRLLRPLNGEPGTYTGRATLDRPGSFSFLVYEGDNPSGRILAREDVLVKIPDREMADSSQDLRSLQEIARESKNGLHVFLADADALADALGGRPPHETEVDRSTHPMWDSMWSLIALLGVLALEWILRKRARLI